MTKELQDLAWKCLPKRFKEEVKSHYVGLNAAYRALFSKDSLTNAECDRCNAMREKIVLYNMYFGYHNLTSDAEGEEMLCVSRKQVQEMYADIINDIRDYNGENPEMVGTTDPILRERATGMKAQLCRLFGSKCLPDEACNVASSDVASSKPKPTEPKFKRCKKVITPSGEVCIIEDTYFENGCWLCLVGDPARWIPESDLEPYTEPKENVNLSQDSANCDKEFDNIPKDSFSKERRLNIAVQMVKAITQCPEIIERIASAEADSLLDDIVDDALHLTDRLISKCEKGGFK